MMLDRRGLLAGAASLSALTACSPKEKPVAASGRTPLRFATDWRAEAEHGGFYQALASGEYAKRGLDVKITQGGPGTNTPQLLATGAADLGVGSNGFGVLNMAAAKIPVKAVMAVFQKDPQVMMAHPDGGVKTLADLKGHPILLSDAAVTSFWPWLKHKYGLTDDQVRKYAGGPGAFVADKNAVQQGYVFSEPVTIAAAAGFKPVTLLLADAGYPGYAGMVLAPDKLIADKPDAVRAFCDASAQGWKDYLWGDPRPADAAIKADNPDMTDELLDGAREMIRTYGLVGIGDAQTAGLGGMSDAGWARFFKMGSGLGVYKSDLDYKSAYTLDFLPGVPRKKTS